MALCLVGQRTVRKKQGSVNYDTDQPKEVSFFSHLWIQVEGGRYQFQQTFELRGKLSAIRCAFLTNDSTRTN